MQLPSTAKAYNYKVVRQFVIATIVWGVVGMAMGVWIASQLVWPEMNLDLPGYCGVHAQSSHGSKWRHCRKRG